MKEEIQTNQNNLLFRSIFPETDKNPERLGATMERIQEVVDYVHGKFSFDLYSLLEKKLSWNGNPRGSVDEEAAKFIAESLVKISDNGQVSQLIQCLQDSEISAMEAIDLHEEFKIPVSRLEKDIIPVSGKGCWVRALDDKTYLDMDSNYSATNLGFDNSQIALGLFNQASRLISMKEDRVHIARARFLKTFRGMLPDGLNQFYWQNSGGEAVDKSLKIAKAYTKTTGVVAFKGGFHGRTHGAVAVTYNPKYRKPFGLDEIDWVHFVEFNDADAVEELFAQGKARIVITELVQSEEAGVRPADPNFVLKLRRLCDHYGGVLICDEVQTGFGRCAGKEGQWFACHVYDVIPDILAIGKSFGGGYPVTAVVTHKRIAQAMLPGYDGSTFGGNPMAMVAAMIATRQMTALNLTKNVVERSRQILDGLASLKKIYSTLGEIRGRGLMIGFDLPSEEYVPAFQRKMAENGVMTSLSTGRTLRILPPLIISEQEVDFLLASIEKTLSNI